MKGFISNYFDYTLDDEQCLQYFNEESDILKYFWSRFSQENYTEFEYLFILYINGDNGLIVTQMTSNFDPESVYLNEESVQRNILDFKPTKMAVAHNHPNRDVLCPSKDDLDLTDYIMDLSSKSNISCIDHYIFNHHSVYSILNHKELPFPT